MPEIMPLSAAYGQVEDALHSSDIDRARKLLDHILVYYPKALRAHALLAEVHALQGHLTDAVAEYELVASVDPTDGSAYARMAQLCANMNRPRDAQRYAALAADHQVADGAELSPLPNQISPARLAILNLRSGLYMQAIQQFGRVLQRAPDRLDLHLAHAHALWLVGIEADCERAAAQILEAAPDCLLANVILGTLRREAGNDADASTCMDAAFEADPEGAVVASLIADHSWGGIPRTPNPGLPEIDFEAASAPPDRPPFESEHVPQLVSPVVEPATVMDEPLPAASHEMEQQLIDGAPPAPAASGEPQGDSAGESATAPPSDLKAVMSERMNRFLSPEVPEPPPVVQESAFDDLALLRELEAELFGETGVTPLLSESTATANQEPNISGLESTSAVDEPLSGDQYEFPPEVDTTSYSFDEHGEVTSAPSEGAERPESESPAAAAPTADTYWQSEAESEEVQGVPSGSSGSAGAFWSDFSDFDSWFEADVLGSADAGIERASPASEPDVSLQATAEDISTEAGIDTPPSAGTDESMPWLEPLDAGLLDDIGVAAPPEPRRDVVSSVGDEFLGEPTIEAEWSTAIEAEPDLELGPGALETDLSAEPLPTPTVRAEAHETASTGEGAVLESDFIGKQPEELADEAIRNAEAAAEFAETFRDESKLSAIEARVAQEPLNNGLRLDFARALEADGKWQRAIEQYAVLTRSRDPRLAPEIQRRLEAILTVRLSLHGLRRTLGDVYMQQGMYERAVEAYSAAFDELRSRQLAARGRDQ